MDVEDLHPWFLGAYAENSNVLRELIDEFVNDHVYWRRNFHPESTPPIPTSAQYRDDYVDFQARLKRELYQLSADLKKSVPFFSPRYVGHMASDLLLPGLIAHIITTLYNPNNVAEEAAPATLAKELDVGMQLADMFGYDTDTSVEPCAWGHLTSGGTVANYEGLRNILAVRLYPLALAGAARAHDAEFGAIERMDTWALVNMSIEEVVELRQRVLDTARQRFDEQTFDAFGEMIAERRFETMGLVEFFRAHPDLEPPRVLVPTTAHYSWEKCMKVLGLGTQHLVEVPVDQNMRMDVDGLRAALDRCEDAGVPVLATIGVLGNTEFGTVDPIKAIADERQARFESGYYFALHIDAAWGGYLASVFRTADGEMVDRDVLRKEFHYFPSQTVYDAFGALSRSDSITVDPHKLGYVPYPAGAYVAADRRTIDFISQSAAYVFDVTDEQPSFDEKLHHLGRYILEGSKPGSSAASVHVTHEVLPLDEDGFGRILKQTVSASEYFFDSITEFEERLDGVVNVEIPFEPDSNLVCLAFNPCGNESLSRMNAFGRELFSHMNVDASRPIQQRDFIASYTSLLANRFSQDRASDLLEKMGIPPEHFTDSPTSPQQSDHIFIVRNTLMNPWLLFEENGQNYIDAYLDYLAELIEDLVG
jgi:glutamate/tyrosine decarboxylase-like PLP-dependent enzyme